MSLVEKTFKNGETIINEGEVGNSFFRLLEGKAYVFSNFGKKDQMQLAMLETGEYFGEMAIIETNPRSATIIAKGNVTVIEIPADELNKYFEKNPDQIIVLMCLLGKRVAAMTKDYNDAQKLLKDLKEADDKKKSGSLFSKIKKYIDLYQSNKDKLDEPVVEELRETLETTGDEGFGQIETLEAGTVIYNEGDVDETMYILHVGTVGFYKNYGSSDEVKESELNDNSFFGELGLLVGEPRTNTAVAEYDDTYVEIIKPDDLETIFLSCPVKINMLLKHLTRRLRKLNVDFLRTCKEITETYDAK